MLRPKEWISNPWTRTIVVPVVLLVLTWLGFNKEKFWKDERSSNNSDIAENEKINVDKNIKIINRDGKISTQKTINIYDVSESRHEEINEETGGWSCECKLYSDKIGNRVGIWGPVSIKALTVWMAKFKADHRCENSRKARGKACKCKCYSL